MGWRLVAGEGFFVGHVDLEDVVDEPVGEVTEQALRHFWVAAPCIEAKLGNAFDEGFVRSPVGFEVGIERRRHHLLFESKVISGVARELGQGLGDELGLGTGPLGFLQQVNEIECREVQSYSQYDPNALSQDEKLIATSFTKNMTLTQLLKK